MGAPREGVVPVGRGDRRAGGRHGAGGRGGGGARALVDRRACLRDSQFGRGGGQRQCRRRGWSCLRAAAQNTDNGMSSRRKKKERNKGKGAPPRQRKQGRPIWRRSQTTKSVVRNPPQAPWPHFASASPTRPTPHRRRPRRQHTPTQQSPPSTLPHTPLHTINAPPKHIGHGKRRSHAPTLGTHLPHHVVVRPCGRGREAGACRGRCHRRRREFRCRRCGGRATPVLGSVASAATANRAAATATVTAAATASTDGPVTAPTTTATPVTTTDPIPSAGAAHTPTASGHRHSSHLAGKADRRWQRHVGRQRPGAWARGRARPGALPRHAPTADDAFPTNPTANGGRRRAGQPSPVARAAHAPLAHAPLAQVDMYPTWPTKLTPLSDPPSETKTGGVASRSGASQLFVQLQSEHTASTRPVRPQFWTYKNLSRSVPHVNQRYSRGGIQRFSILVPSFAITG